METTYVDVLKRKFQHRMDSNPRYSLRAFARSLSVDPGFLSHIFNRKRKLSVSRAMDVARALKMSGSEKSFFINLVRIESARSAQLKNEIAGDLAKSLMIQNVKEMDLQVFAAISTWHHHAILELTFKENFNFNFKNVAKTLNITDSEAKLSIDRLLQLGLLKIVDRRYVKTDGHINPKAQTVSLAQRNRHRQILSKAVEALDSQALAHREFQSITMCIDPALLPEAKKRIQSFAWELCSYLESKNRKEIYEMSLQLFSLESKKDQK